MYEIVRPAMTMSRVRLLLFLLLLVVRACVCSLQGIFGLFGQYPEGYCMLFVNETWHPLQQLGALLSVS